MSIKIERETSQIRRLKAKNNELNFEPKLKESLRGRESRSDDPPRPQLDPPLSDPLFHPRSELPDLLPHEFPESF